MTANPDAWLATFIDQMVVADLGEMFVVIGRLVEVGPDHLTFVDADLHDHREANSTKDVYVLESRRYGIRVNRQRVAIPRRQIVALSKLEDVT